ncbi:MAG: hypothetical protein MZW92_03410 [Comamonadaceae bacterium]|nr:hypothetical protein [Comamonadaceae bacterium]
MDDASRRSGQFQDDPGHGRRSTPFWPPSSKADKGVVRFMYARGFNLPIHAAVVVPDGEGQKVLGCSSTASNWDPAAYEVRSAGTCFMAIELKLNEKGKGEGRFYEDAQLRLKLPRGRRSTIETYESDAQALPPGPGSRQEDRG